ncbi:hypothetical protein [Pseudomonas citronellolis]|uniref:hypothetical protein n=1 Tax=Pseudomonas citronellolis TaxID=53408 RepID=UPI003C2F609F
MKKALPAAFAFLILIAGGIYLYTKPSKADNELIKEYLGAATASLYIAKTEIITGSVKPAKEAADNWLLRNKELEDFKNDVQKISGANESDMKGYALEYLRDIQLLHSVLWEMQKDKITFAETYGEIRALKNTPGDFSNTGKVLEFSNKINELSGRLNSGKEEISKDFYMLRTIVEKIIPISDRLSVYYSGAILDKADAEKAFGLEQYFLESPDFKI